MSEPEEKCDRCGKRTSARELKMWNGICSDCAFDEGGEKWGKILENAKREKVDFT